jgi:Ca2+-binding EF-hand superfamily protein
MAATARQEADLKALAQKTLQTSSDKIELLRAKCLARGANGIRGLSRLFKIMDDDRNHRLELEEFSKGVTEYGLNYSKEEIKELFYEFDKDHSGAVDFDEFLEKLRPPMAKCRIELILKAYARLDKNGDGKVTVHDLKGVYDVKRHPKFLNGEWTEEQILRKFLDTFDTKGKEDGCIERNEFINYYASVSASIDNDAYFDLMMRTNWKLK